MTVVGITPPDFQGVWPGTQMKMYFPLHFEPAAMKMPELLEEKGDNLFEFGHRQAETSGRHKAGKHQK